MLAFRAQFTGRLFFFFFVGELRESWAEVFLLTWSQVKASHVVPGSFPRSDQAEHGAEQGRAAKALYTALMLRMEKARTWEQR